MVGGGNHRVRGCGGRFAGARMNCEGVPCLPAGAVAWALGDERRVPYLLLWQRGARGKFADALRIAAYSEPPDRCGLSWDGWVGLKRPDGGRTLLRTVQRPLPRNGGKELLLVCPWCRGPKRALYGRELDRRCAHSAFLSDWQCRKCAGLRFASEGGALWIRSRGFLGQLFRYEAGGERRERPGPWYPYVFTNPANAERLGVRIREV